ncbi:kinase-like domain-containing protein [Rhizophagus clarus]|uniref:Kinase-like domain-containing protein n=1 Tax=Rhizophagus clarus TaxID=94130 RepID=A0A8H3L9S8_9GLOM|nr:kinase-like domain-containing protein [Rhizophagus clarus]
MELVNTNDKNSFDPTPRLKSSPIQIKFISFNECDKNCVYCGEKYIKTFLSDKFFVSNDPGYFEQRYCKKCLSSYINDITDNNIYLDVYIYTMDLECNEHEISRTKVPQCIQECCRNCGDLTLCSDCYLISSGLIESTLTKKQISILYLPWWHNSSFCNTCYSKLTFTSDNQKYCTNCLIFYIGCRYCLTTNIIFGPTNQSQCKKCKRTSIIINNCGYNGLDDFLLDNVTYDNLMLTEFVNIIKNIGKSFIMSSKLGDFFAKKNDIGIIKWIPYSQFTNVEKMTKGGYGIIYKATWLSKNETVILKRFENSKNIGKYFLNELKSFQHCFKAYQYDDNHIIQTYGFTKDPIIEDYILVLKYASEGDLHKYLQKNFTKVTWNKQKLRILWQISEGLEHIHGKGLMHRDFHSGNILFDLMNNSGKTVRKRYQWKVADLGLSQSVNKPSSNNEIYGVIPYIAPEIFKGSSFSKKSDIYCMEDTPECYANLMKSCWDPDPNKRPNIIEIRETFSKWFFKNKHIEVFIQAEKKRMELLRSKKIGPEFAEKRHSKAIYTSRPLSALISKCSSTYSSSTTSFDSNYFPELENNTVTKSLPSRNLNSVNRNFSTSLYCNYDSTELELDIDIESSSSRNLTSIIKNSLTTLKKRRNEVLLNKETHDHNGKRVKTGTNYP